MTRKKWLVVGGVIVALVLVASVFGVKKYQNAKAEREKLAAVQTVANNYVKSLQSKDFKKLTTLLSNDSIKAEGLDEKELVTKYTNIYEGINATITNIKADEVSYDEADDSYSFSYDMKMTTTLGSLPVKRYTVKFVSDNNEWKVKWLTSLIFPEMKKGDKLHIETFSPVRGTISDKDDAPLAKDNDEGIRNYELGAAGSAITGYVRPVTADDIKDNPLLGEHDVIGAAGLEGTFDKELRGERGGKISIVKEDGKERAELQLKETKNGKDFTTTIDSKLQKAYYAAFANDKAAVTMLNPQTGEVMAAISTPSYNPNDFVKGLSATQWEAYNDADKKPLLNRLTVRYEPASTFKALTASAGIEHGTLIPDEELNIKGLKWQANSDWGDYKVTRVSDVNPVDLKKALVYSDNIYFAQQAIKMGQKAFTSKMEQFGFNGEDKFPLETKAPQLSTDGLKSEVLLADTSYGQGQVLMSPIQLARSYTPFANSGKLIEPQLMKTTEKSPETNAISEETANIVMKDLEAVVSDSQGTAHELRISGHRLAAKTGTAEVGKLTQDSKGSENSSLVVLDADKKEYVLAGILEGSDKKPSHHLIKQVKKVLEEYYN